MREEGPTSVKDLILSIRTLLFSESMMFEPRGTLTEYYQSMRIHGHLTYGNHVLLHLEFLYYCRKECSNY